MALDPADRAPLTPTAEIVARIQAAKEANGEAPIDPREIDRIELAQAAAPSAAPPAKGPSLDLSRLQAPGGPPKGGLSLNLAKLAPAAAPPATAPAAARQKKSGTGKPHATRE